MSKPKYIIKNALSKKQDRILELSGLTGNQSGTVLVAGTSNQIYVRVGGAILRVTNDLVPLVPNIQVIIAKENNSWRVKGTKVRAISGIDKGTNKHGASHGWFGADTVPVSLRQITTLRVTPTSDTMVVEVGRGIAYIAGVPVVVAPTEPIDLTSHIPSTTGQSRFVMISAAIDGSISVKDGSLFDSASFSLSNCPSPSALEMPLALVRLYYGQTKLSENLLYTDIIDIRASNLLPHGYSHASAGMDPIKLDDLGSPDDNTDLNSSTSRHGLLKKLSGNTTDFMRGDGNWATPSTDATSLQGRTVSSTAPALNQRLSWNGSAWVPMDEPAGAGHTIRDLTTIYQQRSYLDIRGATIYDDAANDATRVTVTGGTGGGSDPLENQVFN